MTAPDSTIAEVSAATGLTFRALRFYEDKCLLHPRREGSQRLYSERDRDRVRTIVAAKRLGFTLAETAEILALGGLHRLPTDRLAAQVERLERQRREVDAAIAELRGMMG
jgi:DNA-binding transcriptional MerR regulator